MNFLNFFNKKDPKRISANELLGPTYLEGFTEKIVNPVGLSKNEWKRKLVSKTGNNKFWIRYYGELHQTYKSLIVRTGFAPQKIIAVDIETNEEILLFDGCKIGYNALLCDTFSKEQIESRETIHTYADYNGNTEFSIIISAIYKIDYEEEFRSEVDKNGQIKLINGEWIDFEALKRNGCDHIKIETINKLGDPLEILSKELA